MRAAKEITTGDKTYSCNAIANLFEAPEDMIALRESYAEFYGFENGRVQPFNVVSSQVNEVRVISTTPQSQFARSLALLLYRETL